MWRISLRAALLTAFLFAGGLPLLVFWLWPHSAAVSSELREVKERHQLLAQTLAGALARHHADIRSVFETTAPMIVEGLLLPYAKPLFRSMNFRHLCVFDRETRVLVRGYDIDGPDCPALAPATRFTVAKRLFEAERIVFSQAVMLDDGSPGFVLSYDRGTHIVMAAVGTEQVRALAASISFGRKGHAVVLDSQGRALAHPNEEWSLALRDLSALSIVRDVVAGNPGVGRFVSPAFGYSMVAGHAPVRGVGWGVMVVQPLDELQERAEQVAASARLVFGAGLVLSALVALAFSTHLTRSIRAVSQTAARMAAGDESARVPERAVRAALDEVSTLGRTFNVMAERVAEGRTRIERVARSDSLTGLLNRNGFLQDAEDVIGRAQAHDDQCALFFIDLDHFKTINDSFGHAAGDELLRVVAERLRQTAGASALIARQGGDEFLILTQPGGAASCADLGARLLRALRRPVLIGERRLSLSVSIGVSVFPSDARTAEELVLRADQAMYQVKRKGRNALRLFDAELQGRLDEDVVLVRELRAAVESCRVGVKFQPIVSARTGAVSGFEALARWDSPTLGPVPPERFIAIAEDAGLIVPLGRLIRRQACAFGGRLRAAGAALPVAVNVSQQEMADATFADELLRTIEDNGMAPDLIELEITESLFQNDPETELARLGALKRRGVSFALDDFGKGYSSHSRLRTYPINRLKIAVDFVGDVMTDPGARAVVRSLIDLGRRLRLSVTVEGVETAAQRDLVATLGADHIQGFWHHPPLSANEALALAIRAKRIGAALKAAS